MDTHKIFLNIAQEIASMSKCVSLQVGCIITKNNRIISTGCNGTPAGHVNCCDIFTNYDKNIQRSEHSNWSDKFEIHAEMNAILEAARNGISIDGANLYTLYQPCHNCLKHIIGSGIKEVYYRHAYDRSLYSKETEKLIISSLTVFKQIL